MFLEHGVITLDYLNTKLGTVLTPFSSYGQAIRNYQLSNNQRYLKSMVNSQNVELGLQSQLAKEEKKKSTNYERLDKIIDSVFRHCLYKIKTDPGEDWYISIEVFHPISFDLILDTIAKSDREMHELIFKKLRPDNPQTEFDFKFLRMYPYFKTNPDMIPEVDYRTLKKWVDAGLVDITPIE